MVLRRDWPAVMALLALCGGLFFYGLTSGDLYRTEGLRAVIAADALRTRSVVVPRLYGEPLLTKPPGMYAAIALVSWPFGQVTPWTARLPSALAATFTVLLVYWYFGRQLGRGGGLVAALVLPASFLWLDKVPTAEIDTLQVAWVTGSVLFFLRALEAEEDLAAGKGAWVFPWWLAALMCVAGGFLTKWTAPAFFYLTVVPLLWWRGRLRLLVGWRHLAGATLAATVCLGWAALAVREAGWDTFAETVGREALQRLSPTHHLEALRQLSPNHQRQLYPWAEVVAHPFKVLAAGLPGSALTLLTLWPGFGRLWDERGRRLLQGLHCWAWPSLLFWSVIPEHALRHSFPLLPAFSGLAALVWLAWLRRAGRMPTVRRCVFAGVVVLWLLTKVAFTEIFVPLREGSPNRLADQVAYALRCAGIKIAVRPGGRAPQAKGEAIAALVPPGQTLYVSRLKDDGIMFYYGLSRPPGGPTLPVQRLANLQDLPSHAEPVYCILDETEWQQWPPHVPAAKLLGLPDEQGDGMVLVRVDRGTEGLAHRPPEGPGQ